MKQIEFKTSKGAFVIVDIDTNVKIESLMGGCTRLRVNHKVTEYYDKTYYKLANITEEQASKIVNQYNNGSYENYKKEGYLYLSTARESLKSLIESLGVYLYKNPINIFTFDEGYIRYLDADLKTFYNPHIFLKKVTHD